MDRYKMSTGQNAISQQQIEIVLQKFRKEKDYPCNRLRISVDIFDWLD